MSTERIAVLVVEDESLVRMDIVNALEEAGFEVFEANNARQAIDVLNRNDRIHALFTDIDMPGSIDGLKLAALVRDRWPPIRIIITSGQKTPEAHELPTKGAFLPKPYTPHKVIATIREMVAGS
jgi:DNA-binding NtrC family response regulator